MLAVQSWRCPSRVLLNGIFSCRAAGGRSVVQSLARTRKAGETGGSLGAGRAGAFVVFAAALAVFLAVSADGATFGATSSGLASGSSSDPPSSTLVRPVETVDELVSVGGARMHVRCIGVGDTTLLLIAGFDDGGDNWGPIENALLPARVCSYARFGTGTSDSPPTTQMFSSQAEDLHELMHSIGERGPYLVVGHSSGGEQAVVFTSMFPAEVTGLVLIDATPPTMYEAVCNVPDDGSEAARSLRESCSTLSDPANNPERFDFDAAIAEVVEIDSLGDLPMVVITAAQHPIPGLDPDDQAELNETWHAGQQHWLSLSPLAELISVERAGHYVHLDRPAIVIGAIRGLLQSLP